MTKLALIIGGMVIAALIIVGLFVFLRWVINAIFGPYTPPSPGPFGDDESDPQNDRLT